MNKKQAVMVYLIKDNELLFLNRRKENDDSHVQGKHISIGGKVEPGEGLIEACEREVYEEASIEVGKLDLAGIIYFRGWGEKKKDWINFIFTSTDFKGDPVDGNEGSFEWHNTSKLDKLDLYEGSEEFLKHIINKNYFVMEYQYNIYELIGHSTLFLSTP